MFNATATGNIVKDAVVRTVTNQNGEILAIDFSIAITEKQGSIDKTTFIPCTYWTKSQSLAQYLTKGTPVIVQLDWYSNTENNGKYYQNFKVSKIKFQNGKKQ